MIDMKSISVSCFSEAKDAERGNQDAILLPQRIDNGIVFGIADGVGGYLGAERASQIVINVLARTKRITQSNIDLLFNNFNKAVSDLSLDNPNLHQAATTLSFCSICDEGLYIGHIGDCRVYFRENNTLKQVTNDHTQHRKLIELGVYTPKEIAKLPGKNIITTAIAKNIKMEYDKIFMSWADMRKYICNNEVIIYIMSDGAYHFWDKRKRFSPKTMNDVNRFAVSLKNRIIKSPMDDYSLIGIQFRLH
jgi:protein serine/threonine phosphatase, protein phosphatase 2C-like protein